jgi:outer membrane receptor protein involved in Fe transport
VSRASTDLADQSGESRNRVYRGVGGIKGKFEAFGSPFNFDVSANYGRTDGDFYRTEIDQQKFVNALNVTRSPAGQIVCNPNPLRNAAPGSLSPIADPNCVPLDLFGTNRASDAARNYVTFRGHSSATIEQTDFLATLSSSDLFSLWGADPVGFSVGVEHRKESADFRPDPRQTSGITRNAPIPPVSGSFSTNEVFGELLIPLVSSQNNVPLIDTLEFEGRVRYVDNSVNGGFTAYTLGGRYRPVGDIEFRGNYTRSLRAPSVVELFFPQSPGISQFPDPCDTRLLTQGTNPAVRQANCAAFFSSYGITPGSFTSIAFGAAVPALTGGNPNLRNEAANSYTFGVVLRPSFLPKFQAAIDWNRIRVTDNITLLSPASIAEGCYDDPNFDTANPDAGNQYCRLFQRVRGGASNGQLVANPLTPGLQTTFVNGSFIKFEGLTAEASYRDISLSALGLPNSSLSIQGTLFYLHKFCSSDNGVAVRCFEGTTTNPRYSGQLDVTYSQEKFSLNLGANYRSSTIYDPFFTVESQDILKIKDQVLFDLSATFDVTEKTQFRFTVNNLLDTPPIFPTRIGDLLGRRFTVRVSHAF